MHTWLCVLIPISLCGQHLPTLTTWELLTPMHAHMNLYPVVRFETLLTNWAWCFTPWDHRNFIQNLCNLSSLCPFRQVFTLKKGWNLLLYSFQSPLLYDHLITSNLEQCWTQSRLWFRSSRHAGSPSGHSWCHLHTLCLVLTGKAYIWFILGVRRMKDLPTGHFQLCTLPDGLQQITVSFNWKIACGSLVWSFTFILRKQWVIRWFVQNTLHEIIMWVIRLLTSIF